CIAAILGDAENGAWRIAPADAGARVSRRYRDRTLALETRFETADGAVTLTDFMPLRSDILHLVRIVRGERGRVRMGSHLKLRFDYGRLKPWLVAANGGLTAVAGPHAVRLHAETPLAKPAGPDVEATFEVEGGQSVAFTLSYFPSHGPPPERPDARALLAASTAAWRDWT